MTDLNTFADVINRLGGPAEYGRAIGIATERAAEQRSRNSIPAGYWPAVIAAANACGEAAITLELLADLAKRRRPPARQLEQERVAS